MKLNDNGLEQSGGGSAVSKFSPGAPSSSLAHYSRYFNSTFLYSYHCLQRSAKVISRRHEWILQSVLRNTSYGAQFWFDD